MSWASCGKETFTGALRVSQIFFMVPVTKPKDFMKITPEGMPWRVEIAKELAAACVVNRADITSVTFRMYARQCLAWADILIHEHEKEFPAMDMAMDHAYGTIRARADRLTEEEAHRQRIRDIVERQAGEDKLTDSDRIVSGAV